MEEIKVNEYVRTKNGQIYKIEDGTEFYEDSVNVGIGIIPDVDGIWVDKEHFTYVDKREIVKHSSNIIDLIEYGDYVNGYFIEENRGRYLKTDEIDYSLSSLGHLEPLELNAEEIKWVITREQIEEMKYIVKE